jgi:hypothetical protein
MDEWEREILKLKGETTRPKIKPSKMDKGAADDGNEDDSTASKQKKWPKRSKTEHLKINATITVKPGNIPEGSSFKGFKK